jgi:hypothetical protein
VSETTFFEITFPTAADYSVSGRQDIEDRLDEALQQAGLGEVTGGGTGMGLANIDVEVTDSQRGLILVREVLQSLGLAPSTIIRQSGSPDIEHPLYLPTT